MFEQRAFEADVPYTPPAPPASSTSSATRISTASAGGEGAVCGIAMSYNSNENGTTAAVDGSSSSNSNVNTSIEMTAAGLDIDATATVDTVGIIAEAGVTEGTTTAVKQRRAVPFRYSLHFPDLVYPPQERIQRDAEEKEGAGKSNGESGDAEIAAEAGTGDHIVAATTGPKSRGTIPHNICCIYVYYILYDTYINNMHYRCCECRSKTQTRSRSRSC